MLLFLFTWFLYFSFELQPSSQQGLLALSALGSITSDLTLAATALAELVKIGQKGSCLNFRPQQ